MNRRQALKTVLTASAGARALRSGRIHAQEASTKTPSIDTGTIYLHPDKGADARQRHLLADRRHRVSAIEHMRDLVPGEALEVFGLQPAPVAHLNPIRPAFGELPQELVQIGDEVPATLVVLSCLRGAFSAGHSAGGRNRPNRGPGL